MVLFEELLELNQEWYNESYQNKIGSIVGQILKDHKKELGCITYILCSDEYLLELNQKHLQHDTLTDIITFPLSEEGEKIVSDVFISTERVEENAKTFGTEFKMELSRVMIHGALHLVGLKDKSADDKKSMRTAEDKYLSMLS